MVDGISRYGRWVLLLTAGFLLFTGGWFLSRRCDARPFQVTAQRPLGESASQDALGPAEGADGRPDSLLEGEVIDLNLADLYDLQRLPGIGEKKAQAILDYRAANGPFQSVEELTQVEGIGPVTLENLRPYITAADTEQ